MAKRITNYKMTKQTFNEYVEAGILVNLEKPVFHKHRSAIIKCDGHSIPTKKFPVSVEVTGYYAQTQYIY